MQIPSTGRSYGIEMQIRKDTENGGYEPRNIVT